MLFNVPRETKRILSKCGVVSRETIGYEKGYLYMKKFICTLCPRNCAVVRGETGNGVCGMGAEPRIARAAPHFDEEPVISGSRGSGAVFFSGCSLKCCFCQNFELSHGGFGKTVSTARLREIYFELIAQGVHNINLVNPTHFANAIYDSLEGGLPVPVVWNSGGYEKVETLRRFEGRVQIYLPDLKYMRADSARKYSRAADYFDYAAPALREMLRQTGSAVIGPDGLMRSGVIIRHLILPGCADESIEILDFIKRELPGAWVSLMAQYLPFGEAAGVDELGRRLTQAEYDRVADHLLEIGLDDGFIQELSSSDEQYIPKFDLTGV